MCTLQNTQFSICGHLREHGQKIYVGIHEISSITVLLSKGLRELGFDVTNVVEDRSSNDINPHGREGYRPHDDYFDGSNNIKYIKTLLKNS